MAELNEETKSVIKSSLNREENILKLGLRRWGAKLKKFEEEHRMTSSEFIEKFNSGDLGDDKIWFEWDFALEAYEHLKNKLHQIKMANYDL